MKLQKPRLGLGLSIAILSLTSCGGDKPETASAVFPNIEKLQGLESLTPLTSLEADEMAALKSASSMLIVTGLYDRFGPDEDEAAKSEVGCALSGKLLLLKREAKSNQEKKQHQIETSTEIQDCKYHPDFDEQNGEMLLRGKISTAVTVAGSSDAKALKDDQPLSTDLVIFAQSSSGSMEFLKNGASSGVKVSFSNLLYAAKVSAQTKTQYNEISLDPLGPEVQKSRRIEFWKNLIKCSGTVKLGSKTYSCGQMAVTLFPQIFDD